MQYCIMIYKPSPNLYYGRFTHIIILSIVYINNLISVCEYVIILGNMWYHAMSYKDFSDWTITVGPNQMLSR